MSTPTIIFDLDGTLIDTAPDLIATLNVVLAGEGLPPLPYDVARALIGHGARHMIEHALALDGRTPVTAQVDGLFDTYIAYYADHVADHSRPFPGLEPALTTLAGCGFRLAVCTNKLEWLAVRLLDALGLSDRFVTICGQDTFGVQKPDPRALHGTLRRAGGVLDRAVMVGDSQADIAAAKAAPMPVVAVDFGYTEIPVAQLGPDRIISHFNVLPDIIAELFEADTAPAADPSTPSGTAR